MSEQLVKKILILAANPKDIGRLRLNEEVRDIQEGLGRSKSRERFIMKGEVQRKDITEIFKEHGIVLSRDQLDKALDFIKQFGVLQKLKNGHFRVLSGYLTDAIKTNDPDPLLESELGKGRAG
ncbi:MAG: hypothetical protein KME28_26665 [Pelatocladus maniniholoensis HA4357-MV3]|jgi:hypothetical protein|uniref:Uncharacterized protein n=1 Tax=Pelatocladus maniniholoensis HA4357-MV3 TaxID=1117104 RepID=A0A9E3HDC4_9NOST|nr:hypothetical protein [Pelatocladus maniniholoensis HA4357-MV3]